MPQKQDRRTALKSMLAGTAAIGAAGMLPAIASENSSALKFKGNINHSVCQWCYNFIPLEELCKEVKKIGFGAIDLIAPKDWPILQQYGLFSSMCYHGGKVSLTNGFNRVEFHEQLIKDYT